MGWFTKKLNTRNDPDALDVALSKDSIKQAYFSNMQAIPHRSTSAYVTLGYQGAQTGTGVSPMNTSTAVYTLVTSNGKEIVKIEKNGEITWPNGTDVDAAAEAFSKSIHLGSEKSAGITEGMRQRTRDMVFNELIKLIDETGSITSVELTRYWEAAKIMDKLKGVI